MKKNHSPWIHQLNRKREIISLDKNHAAQILIVGGGIAGVMTTYNILKHTSYRVTLIDGDLAGHGASGHNAGQLTTYFERPLADIAREFGTQMACEGQSLVESAWKDLDVLIDDISLKTPVYKFTGYAGITNLNSLISHLTDNMVRYNGGIPTEKILVAENFKDLSEIPSTFSHLYEVTSQDMILNVLESNNKDYIAALCYLKGATNSAKICEETIIYCLENYKDRFCIYEKTRIDKIDVYQNHAISQLASSAEEAEKHKIWSEKIILCTNGFEGFVINNHAGPDINTKFHHNIQGAINYMSAYIDEYKENPTAISYFQKQHPQIVAEASDITGEIYFYLTRRPHIHNDKEVGLISIGGPEKKLEERDQYNREDFCDPWAENLIEDFMKKNYVRHKKESIDYDFCWHGLVGYTSNGIRMVGEEPNNPVLMYNLGCNAVGIMPSIYGSKRIAQILNKEKLPKSIFDPKLHDLSE